MDPGNYSIDGPDRNTEDDEKRVRFYSNCRKGGGGQEGVEGAWQWPVDDDVPE